MYWSVVVKTQQNPWRLAEQLAHRLEAGERVEQLAVPAEWTSAWPAAALVVQPVALVVQPVAPAVMRAAPVVMRAAKAVMAVPAVLRAVPAVMQAALVVMRAAKAATVVKAA